MVSVVDGLNELLIRERGEVEAVEALLEELEDSDIDITDGVRDVLRTATWSCSGLYHRINQLGGTPTLDASDLADELSDKSGTKAKIEVLCHEQKRDEKMIKALLGRELDQPTRSLLEDLLRAHEESEKWCMAALGEWKVEAKKS